jgi:hypothetical protein
MLVDKVTPKKRKRRKRTSNSSTTQPLSSSRVTQASFTPTSLHVTNTGRYAIRIAIATEHAFPSEREDWTWGTLEAAMPKESSLAAKLALIKEDDDRAANLITYVYLFSLKRCQANTHIEAYGGAAQLRGQVKTLCVAAVSLFNIPGKRSREEIKDLVGWLTCKKNIFKYGGVDIKVRVHTILLVCSNPGQKRMFDPQQPYGHEFYQDVISKQWFSSQSSEGVRVISAGKFVDLVPLLTLVTDAVRLGIQIDLIISPSSDGELVERVLHWSAHQNQIFSRRLCGAVSLIRYIKSSDNNRKLRSPSGGA